jgi:Mediator of RNA pol II transcription subunit 19
MSTSSSHIMWNAGLVERLLQAIITTGAHLNAKKWKDAALSFYSSMPHLMDIYRTNEESSIRRLKEKYSEEQKRVCQTMGWRDYNQGNLSAFDGDLGPVEAKMRQIIQEQDEKKEEKEKAKSRQKRLGEISVSSLDVRNEGSMKPKKARTEALTSILGGPRPASVSISNDSPEDEVIFLYCACFIY